jgi:hypothetical protein
MLDHGGRVGRRIAWNAGGTSYRQPESLSPRWKRSVVLGFVMQEWKVRKARGQSEIERAVAKRDTSHERLAGRGSKYPAEQ